MVIPPGAKATLTLTQSGKVIFNDIMDMDEEGYDSFIYYYGVENNL